MTDDASRDPGAVPSDPAGLGAVPPDPVDFAVVGTDTGVGKTVVTAALVARLRAAGVDARAVKPAQTGFPPDDDAGFVADACGTDAAATCLERLEPALAPAVAADREGVSLSYDRIREGCREAMADAAVGAVEGIGGLRVPLADAEPTGATSTGAEPTNESCDGGAERREVVDLVADLGVPAVVVARSGLGTLNHTALTVEALARRDCPVHGVVLNEYAGETVAERTNPAVLERMTGLPVWTVPPVAFETPGEAAERVNDHLSPPVVPTADAENGCR